jgi:hypothetical protein
MNDRQFFIKPLGLACLLLLVVGTVWLASATLHGTPTTAKRIEAAEPAVAAGRIIPSEVVPRPEFRIQVGDQSAGN